MARPPAAPLLPWDTRGTVPPSALPAQRCRSLSLVMLSSELAVIPGPPGGLQLLTPIGARRENRAWGGAGRAELPGFPGGHWAAAPGSLQSYRGIPCGADGGSKALHSSGKWTHGELRKAAQGHRCAWGCSAQGSSVPRADHTSSRSMGQLCAQGCSPTPVPDLPSS